MSDLEVYPMVGAKIAARRKELRLKQAEVADQIGLTRASLANIEKGRQRVMLHQLYRIAAALRLDSILDLVPKAYAFEKSDQPVVFTGSEVSDSLKAKIEHFVRHAPVRR